MLHMAMGIGKESWSFGAFGIKHYEMLQECFKREIRSSITAVMEDTVSVLLHIGRERLEKQKRLVGESPIYATHLTRWQGIIQRYQRLYYVPPENPKPHSRVQSITPY